MKRFFAYLILCGVLLSAGLVQAYTGDQVDTLRSAASERFNKDICDFVDGQSLCIWEEDWITPIDFDQDGLMDYILEIPPPPADIVLDEEGNAVRFPVYNFPPAQTRIYRASAKKAKMVEVFRGSYARVSFEKTIPPAGTNSPVLVMRETALLDECTYLVTVHYWDKDRFVVHHQYEALAMDQICVGPYVTKDRVSGSEGSGTMQTLDELIEQFNQMQKCDPLVDGECGC